MKFSWAMPMTDIYPQTPAADPIQMIRLGPYLVRNRLLLAPMAGVSDQPYRELCLQQGAGLAVAEYAPNAVKKAVIGVGHGDKKQIHMMVKVLLPKALFDSEHAADALAIAICHAHHRQSVAGRLAALAHA